MHNTFLERKAKNHGKVQAIIGNGDRRLENGNSVRERFDRSLRKKLAIGKNAVGTLEEDSHSMAYLVKCVERSGTTISSGSFGRIR